MNRFISRGFFVLSGALFFAGCRSSHEEAVATVGGSAITISDLKGRLQDTPAAYQQYATTQEGRKQFLNLLIREKVLLEESRKGGLQNNENYRRAVGRFKKKMARDMKDYEESLLIEMYLARLRAKEITVTDADVRAYYDARAADFQHPVELQVSHILVNTPEEAQKALDRLKAGDSFETVARAVSMDPPTAARGGKLAPFTRGSLMPEFENAAFGLKNGEVSGIVKTPFGYHLLKRTGQKTLPTRSFDQAKDEIQNRLQREKFDQWVTKAQASLGVHINEKALAAVMVAPAAGRPGPSGGESLQ